MKTSAEAQLRLELAITALICAVAPTFLDAVLSSLAGGASLGAFFSKFVGPFGVFIFLNCCLMLALAQILRRRGLRLVERGAGAAPKALAAHALMSAALMILAMTALQIVGAGLRQPGFDGALFSLRGGLPQGAPLIIATSLCVWSMPVFALCIGAFSRFFASKSMGAGAFSLPKQVLGLGLAAPIMTGALLFGYAAGEAPEAFVAALGAAVAISLAATLILTREIAAGLAPLQAYADRAARSESEAWRDVQSKSLDELGVVAARLREVEAGRAALTRKLAESEARVAEAQKIAQMAGFTLSRDGRIVWDGDSAKNTGLAPESVADTLDAFCAGALEASDAKRLQKAIAEGWRSGAPVSCDVWAKGVDDAPIRCRIRARAQTDAPPGGGEMFGVLQDITESARLEEELRQSQKMEAIGALAGGVAHDVNNVLAVILGNVELLAERLEDPAEKAFAEDAIKATKHGADMTRSMLSFARRARLDPEPIDLNQIITGTQAWARRALPASIEIETSLLAGLWTVEADRIASETAILNLLLNARDAMPNGGKLTIETANMRIDEAYIESRREDLAPGRYVMAAVTDTGVGIPQDQLEQIFLPFYTTKKSGDGTGLGLAMVHGFMKQSEGAVRAYSEVGMGTTVKLYFPAVSTTAKTPQRPQSSAEKPTSNARILLVEDQAPVQAALMAVLQASGYEVVAASSGDEALELFQEIGPVDLLLTDVVMPGTLQGPALAREIRARAPKLPVIFMSGYASEATVHGNGLRPEDIRLMKPVARADLIDAVERRISSSSAKA